MDAFGDPLPASDEYEYFEEVGHGRFSEVGGWNRYRCSALVIKYMRIWFIILFCRYIGLKLADPGARWP